MADAVSGVVSPPSLPPPPPPPTVARSTHAHPGGMAGALHRARPADTTTAGVVTGGVSASTRVKVHTTAAVGGRPAPVNVSTGRAARAAAPVAGMTAGDKDDSDGTPTAPTTAGSAVYAPPPSRLISTVPAAAPPSSDGATGSPSSSYAWSHARCATAVATSTVNVAAGDGTPPRRQLTASGWAASSAPSAATAPASCVARSRLAVTGGRSPAARKSAGSGSCRRAPASRAGDHSSRVTSVAGRGRVAAAATCSGTARRPPFAVSGSTRGHTYVNAAAGARMQGTTGASGPADAYTVAFTSAGRRGARVTVTATLPPDSTTVSRRGVASTTTTGSVSSRSAAPVTGGAPECVAGSPALSTLGYSSTCTATRVRAGTTAVGSVHDTRPPAASPTAGATTRPPPAVAGDRNTHADTTVRGDAATVTTTAPPSCCAVNWRGCTSSTRGAGSKSSRVATPAAAAGSTPVPSGSRASHTAVCSAAGSVCAARRSGGSGQVTVPDVGPGAPGRTTGAGRRAAGVSARGSHQQYRAAAAAGVQAAGSVHVTSTPATAGDAAASPSSPVRRKGGVRRATSGGEM